MKSCKKRKLKTKKHTVKNQPKNIFFKILLSALFIFGIITINFTVEKDTSIINSNFTIGFSYLKSNEYKAEDLFFKKADNIETAIATKIESDNSSKVAITIDNNASTIETTIAPIKTNKKIGTVALTYDDGPSRKITPQILDILSENNVSATFFVLGRRSVINPDIILQIKLDGHEIANHGYDHTAFTKLSNESMKKQIKLTNDIIYKITNERPLYVRPPYGAYDERVIKQINHPLILWSIDSNDWRNIPVDDIIDNVLSQLDDGSIILLHDVHQRTVEVTRHLVPKILELGYDIVSVAELLNQYDKTPISHKIYRKIKK
jgi:peptidoglycan-N-acetylglucosamine deacetylase